MSLSSRIAGPDSFEVMVIDNATPQMTGTVTISINVNAVQNDFNGDGKADVLIRHAVTGELYLLQMDASIIASHTSVISSSDLSWKVKWP